MSLPSRVQYAGPRDQNLTLLVAGGLLDLLHRVQNGEASCLYAAKLIEIIHEEETQKAIEHSQAPAPRPAFNPHWDRKPISIDFDTPLHLFSRGYCQADIYDEPTPGAHDALKRLLKDYAVHILSARDAREVIKWCRERFPDLQFALIPADAPDWQTEGVIGVTNTKLPAILYIDDRALRFTSWQDIMKYLT